MTAINFLLFMTRFLYCLSISEPLNLLAKNKLIQVDRNDQWFGRGTAVWLTRENPSLRRNSVSSAVLADRSTAFVLCCGSRYPRGSGLSDDATFRLLLATARFLRIPRRVATEETEYSDTSTSRIRQNRRAANRSTVFRECVPGTTTGAAEVLQVPHRSRSPARPVEVRSETSDRESRRDSAKLSRCEGRQ